MDYGTIGPRQAPPGSSPRLLDLARPTRIRRLPYVRSTQPGEADVVAQGPGNEVRYYWATPGSPWQHTILLEVLCNY